MNNKILLLFLILSIVLLTACENIDVSKISDSDMQKIADKAIVCNPPYMRFEMGCCLDTNNNSICDNDEQNIVQVDEPTSNLELIDTDFEKIIANSANWKDVYSSLLYAGLVEKQPGLFLTSEAQKSSILYSISKATNGILIISSDSQPYVSDYKKFVSSQGYEGVEELTSDNINIGLARKAVKDKNIVKFIIVDDKQGYDAISVASYAVKNNYYVLFANENNIALVESFLDKINPQKIIIYGAVDNAVNTRLSKYTPDIINTGDKYSDSVSIVKLYQENNHSNQLLLTSGKFIEASLISGKDPVLLINNDTLSESTIEYIKNSNIDLMVVIDNDLINAATTIRRQFGISVFVKFAQGARNPDGTVASAEDLDKFPVPQ